MKIFSVTAVKARATNSFKKKFPGKARFLLPWQEIVTVEEDGEIQTRYERRGMCGPSSQGSVKLARDLVLLVKINKDSGEIVNFFVSVVN
ncbi:putative flavin-nucleotide-binding protein (plasmid) [Desulfovibrio ferrophilus]|uniref:Putative flavin-nucleotide-binding protein n=1 Tax=Desulfovibrio ferrophilus TaxID=241368 RepID=A0A2Z6B3T5_9BACT|nr:putative flavin-nucleotide-binding protein [Desulfovibrio ferrophilus]